MKTTTWLAFALLALVPVFAQGNRTPDHPGCKVYFTVYWADAHIPGGYALGMHKEQEKWWEKTLVKKYPNVCLNAEQASYVILWSSEFRPFSLTLPAYHQSTATISGDVNATANVGWYENQTVQSKTNNVFMFIFPFNPTSATTISPSDKPIFATHHESWWTYRAAHRQALEDAIKFLDALPERQAADRAKPAAAVPVKAGEANEPGAKGAIAVTTSPEAAEIYVDGAFVGNSTSTLKLVPGKHTIRVTAPGYREWSREISVSTGSESKLVVNLEKL